MVNIKPARSCIQLFEKIFCLNVYEIYDKETLQHTMHEYAKGGSSLWECCITLIVTFQAWTENVFFSLSFSKFHRLLTTCHSSTGWGGRRGDVASETLPSNSGRSLRDIRSSILIFTRWAEIIKRWTWRAFCTVYQPQRVFLSPFYPTLQPSTLSKLSGHPSVVLTMFTLVFH